MAGAGKKMNGRNKETKLIFLAVALLFGAFLVVPVARLLAKSFLGDSGITTAFYKEVFGSRGFITAMGNSFLIAGTSALVTTFLAFLMAYTVHYTNVNKCFKKLIELPQCFPCFCQPLLMDLQLFIPLEEKDFLQSFWESSCFPFMDLRDCFSAM